MSDAESFSEDDPKTTNPKRVFTIDQIWAEYGLNKTVIIVADPAPLIALTAADNLAVLLRAEIRFEIPDVVYWEALQGPAFASRIVAWMNANKHVVRFAPTRTGIEYTRRLQEGRPNDAMGEQAAIQTLHAFFDIHPLRRARLLVENPAQSVIPDDRASLVTLDELRVLANLWRFSTKDK